MPCIGENFSTAAFISAPWRTADQLQQHGRHRNASGTRSLRACGNEGRRVESLLKGHVV